MNRSNDEHDSYVDVEYLQFNKSRTLEVAERIAGILTWPLIVPLALISRSSELLFRTLSEFFSLVPYIFGVICRYEFYRFSLREFGRNVQVEFGTIFIHRDISIGDNVLIGRYSIIHHCSLGDNVLIGERCTFLSGSRQHSFDRLDVPMTKQGGQKKRIRVESDCWIGSHAIVMESVCTGSIVAAGSVVAQQVEKESIVAGNPAKLIRMRRA